MHLPYSHQERGALLVLVLVFGTVFFLIVVAFMGFVVTQSRQQLATVEKEQALAVAEAGLNYYKWYLAHNPGDVTHGTGALGPYVLPYEDTETGVVGEFSLEVASTSYCGVVSSIDIYSTGTASGSAKTRTVYGRYAQPTVAEYAYIINSNVWAGDDRVIIGPYHSNGGIRMDGTNNSTVSSGQETWTCTSQFGCSPGGTRDGVFTTTSNPNTALFTFPSTPINFTGLTVDLSQMKARAISHGIYLPDSGDEGYQIRFNSNGTITSWIVDRVWSHDEYSTEAGNWYTARNLIRDLRSMTNHTINAGCPLIYVEDKVWLTDSVVNQKVTIAAADTDTPGNDYSMILGGNITYSTSTAGLLAIAEDDMLVGYDAPNDMTLNGIFVAQNGKFGRNHYHNSEDGGDRCRNSLTINGTIVSNGRVGTQWTGSGCTGGYGSGFRYRYNSYDRDLVDAPPPLAPRTSDDYKFVEWREMD